jgi:three-Cys-motif partner protein
MTTKQTQLFGGNWTEEKLEMLRKYLVAYSKIMNKQSFRFAYIDAFAGTGDRQFKQKQEKAPLFPELSGREPREFYDGSARIALQVKPPFMKYIFIEKDVKRFSRLVKLREEFPLLSDRISLVNEDCNVYLKDRCINYKWTSTRAVLFLDPFGMQVEWSTMEAIAGTKAIDVWILFPLGIAVNRLLKKDGNIEDSWRARLDLLFGTTDWFAAFYKEQFLSNLFGKIQITKKVCTLESISIFYIERLKTIFPRVAEKPRPLCNSKGNPLFHLCFAVANPKGADLAMNIAKHILEG